ncbi:NAD(P)/FAD-dependent oxidoreductase [Spirillospora sp. CA-294931]|uniref:NAD(P)/FAD-dependent oxidoreductase n=1 Tax=Spirillospora sp. CA-294931 TaxID=3240042 RepID=UPI003D8DCED5
MTQANPPAGTGASHRPDPDRTYDVALLGAHLATGMLAAILARAGLRVLVAGVPQDATELSGETTVPYTAEVFMLLADRFEVPEIAAFGRFSDLPADLRRGSGIKRSLGFLYHREGTAQDPRESVQFNVPGEHTEWHPYRPDVDRYAIRVAEKYGVVTVPAGVVAEDAWVEDGAEGRVRCDDGTVYRARFLVDCAGPRSPLVRRHGGDDTEPRLQHRSRVLAARMRGVAPFEDLVDGSRYPRASAWSQGTVHHLFDGGWLQLASFGNHGHSTNDGTSVTLSLDPDAFPDLPADPGQAFRAVVDRFPDLKRQFDTAVPDAWRDVPLIQRTAARTHGDRWFALERSAVRDDLLLARDVTMTAELVHALAGALIPALREGDLSAGRFAEVARFQERLAAFHDAWLAGARAACADFALLNAFCRVWLLWQILADLSLKRARLDCKHAAARSGRPDWSPVERFDLGGVWFRAPGGLRELIDFTMDTLGQVRSGALAPRIAADDLFARLRRDAFVPPLYAFGDPAARIYRFTFLKRLQMLWWVKTKAPADFRRLLTQDNVTSVSTRSSR